MLLARPYCWFKGHDWEHRVQFIIIHYWRCKRCYQAANFNDFPDNTRELYEQEKIEFAASEERYQRERESSRRQELRRWRLTKSRLRRKSKKFLRDYTWSREEKRFVKRGPTDGS